MSPYCCIFTHYGRNIAENKVSASYTWPLTISVWPLVGVESVSRPSVTACYSYRTPQSQAIVRWQTARVCSLFRGSKGGHAWRPAWHGGTGVGYLAQPDGGETVNVTHIKLSTHKHTIITNNNIVIAIVIKNETLHDRKHAVRLFWQQIKQNKHVV